MAIFNSLRPGSVLFVLATLTACVLVGGLAALLPIGLYLRLSLPIIGLGVLFFAWSLRDEKNAGMPGMVYAGLLTLVALSVLWPRYIFIHKAGLPGVNPFTLLTMGMLALVLIHLLTVPSYGRKVLMVFQAGRGTVLLVITWFLWRVFTSLLGVYPLASVVDLAKEVVYIGSFVLFGLAVFSEPNGGRHVLRILVGCGLIASLIGLAEGFAGRNLVASMIPVGAGSAEAASTLANIALDKVREGGFRAQSVFSHPILFAQYSAAMVPLALFCMARDRSWLWRIAAALALPLALLAILKSGSRAGIVSVVIACGVTGAIWWLRSIVIGRTSRLLAILALPLLIGIVGISAVGLSELASGRSRMEAGSSSVRITMISNGVRALESSPVTGFGQGMALVKVGVVNSRGTVTIDSYPLTVALESGYVGLTLFFLVFGVFSINGLRWAVSGNSDDHALVAAAVASVICLFATSTILSTPHNMTFVWLLMGLPFGLWAHRTQLSGSGAGVL